MLSPASSSPFAVVVPYYNEADYLTATLASWLGQNEPPRQLILVDNGSTDGSETAARRALAETPGLEVQYLHEATPGKIHALATGCAAVEAPYTVLCDADTYYPPHYLALCRALFERASSDVIALMALPAYGDPYAPLSWLRRAFYVLLSNVLRGQAHTGGYGQVCRTEALRAAGGFSAEQWPYVLLDHEFIHRLLKRGRTLYHVDLWCKPSPRRRDRGSVRWTLGERLLYNLTPYAAKDWYFYDFLGPRLAKRGLSHLNLRAKTWLPGETPETAEPTTLAPRDAGSAT